MGILRTEQREASFDDAWLTATCLLIKLHETAHDAQLRLICMDAQAIKPKGQKKKGRIVSLMDKSEYNTLIGLIGLKGGKNAYMPSVMYRHTQDYGTHLFYILCCALK